MNIPANLPPEYFEIERKYREAKSISEKIRFLEKMLSVMPKHKGTDRLREELTKKLSRLEELAEKRISIGRGVGQQYAIRKEGAGQVALVGLSNSGKSSLFSALTSSPAEISPYPYTTQYPKPGMMKFEDIQIQLIDLPPLTGEEPGWLVNLLRNADLLLIIVDLQEDAITQAELILDSLYQKRIRPLKKDDFKWSEDIGIRFWEKRMVIVGNKIDVGGAEENFIKLRERFNDFVVLSASAKNRIGLDELRKAIFDCLEIIRVYTKSRGQRLEESKMSEPLILPKESTVKEAAYAIHKEIAKKFKYAIIWGEGKFDGQRVGRDYPLKDGDIIELRL